MKTFITVKEASLKWNLSERSVRNYCALGRIDGAILEGRTWLIPEKVKKPTRKNEKPNKNYLLEKLREEKKSARKSGIYHKLQINLTYNSNHMEGSELSHEETRYIFETRTIGLENKTWKVDDIIETINHFTTIDRVIDFCNYELSESFIKELHKILKTGTADARLSHFAVGEYKKEPNMVGDLETTHPRLVAKEMKLLVDSYNQKNTHTLREIIEFHVLFERIHPFQDGNGRVGRLIALKECLKNNIVPFIILDKDKMFYYRGLNKWDKEQDWLVETCLHGQDIVKSFLEYFHIPY